MQKFLEIAMDELGVHETPGVKATERIVEYAKHTDYKAISDEVPWCSSFMCWVVDTAGYISTHSAAARSWLQWGVAKIIPTAGCIAVLERKTKDNPNSAHVTIFVSFTDDPIYFWGIGGNQGDSVKRSKFPLRDVLGFRDAV